MATAVSRIPHGSILASLRQRQMDEYQAAEEKKKKNAAFTNQMIQLGGMAAGAALAIPTGGGSLALASMLTGASLGGVGGGLLGNAVTGTPTSPMQGANALMSIAGQMDSSTRANSLAQSREIRDTQLVMDMGMVPFTPDPATNDVMGPDDLMIGKQAWTPGGAQSRMDSASNFIQGAGKNETRKFAFEHAGIKYSGQNKPEETINITGDGRGNAGVVANEGQIDPRFADPRSNNNLTTIGNTRRQGDALIGRQLNTSYGTKYDGPKIGDIEDGQRYIGGDPASPKSWEEIIDVTSYWR